MIFLTTEDPKDPDERHVTVFPSRTAPESQLLLVCAISLKDMSYESSQLKPEINKMTEKKEKSGYQGQYKRRKKFRMGTRKRGLVDDIVELKRFRIRVIDST